ncbi:SphA family protein [Pseudomonas alvandae]|uniref:Transporter n=1 Tax=Pseudomonas canavaninivorans TaxID=2842348 RepID=A0ABX8QJ72_PSECO|nr:MULTISPECIES: transporter [Pseudomonas]QXI55450.1 transporter [Pseudomonas alvandae]UVM74576.1 transporter [Pseudomonas canavaninivorans]
MNPIRTRFTLQLTLGLACANALPALATESGVDNIGTGTDGFYVLPLEVDSLPDHMVAFNLYYNHYKARKFNISSLGGEVPGVEIESTAVIPRIDYLSPLRVAGGRLGIYVAQPWLKQEVAAFGLSDTRESMGDTTISPIILWDMGKHLTLAAAVEITVPTGEYDADRLANTSNNFYTYKPLFSFTWLPTDNTELSMKTTYSFNRENKDTDYRSGQIFHFDYSASYRLNDNVTVGLNGYYLKQTTDDKQYGRTVQFAGQDVDDGVRGEVFAIGPALHVTFLKYASAEIRWAKEFDVENRPEGEMLWAKISIPFAF